MKRRIFIAIDLPPALKQKVAEAVKSWHWLPIRWLKPEHWHITLIPPAYFEDAEVTFLTALFQKSKLGKAFPLRFSRVTLAPPGVSARMIWLEGEAPRELARLKERIEGLWSSHKSELPLIKRETRPLKLHVTLARFQPGELRELQQKIRVLGDVDVSYAVKRIVVMESHLKPSGAEYETLATISLAS